MCSFHDVLFSLHRLLCLFVYVKCLLYYMMWLFLYEKRSLDYILTLIRNVRCSLQCLLCLFLCVKALNLLHVVSVPLYKVIPTSLRGAFSFMWSKLRYVVQTILWGANVFMRCKLLYVLTSLCANFFMWWTFRRCVDVGSFYIDAHASRSLGPCARELWKRHHSWVSLIQDSRFKFQVSSFKFHVSRSTAQDSAVNHDSIPTLSLYSDSDWSLVTSFRRLHCIHLIQNIGISPFARL